MEKNNNGCVLGAKHEERINALEGNLSRACNDISEIKDTLLGRPTWAVTWSLSLLCSFMFTSVAFNVTLLRILLTK